MSSPRYLSCLQSQNMVDRPCFFSLGKRSEHPMRQTGTVKFFNQAKGFGFITPDEGGKDVFVHISAVERSGVGMLDEGMRVSYETQPDPKGKGPKAVNLERAE